VRKWSAMLACLAAFAWVPAQAMVIRHDRDDRQYIELAKKFPATVIFHVKNSGNGMDGMGTLIDARWVLTAGHIVAELKPGDFAEIGGSRYEIEELVQQPLWHGIKSWDDVQNDIALVRLRTAVRGIEPALLYTKSDEAGFTLTLVGAGRFGNGLTGPTFDDLTMRAATNRVLRVEGTQLVFRFDAPDDPDVTPLEGISGDGDSGGPAYLESNGKLYVVGVGSAQDARPVGRKLGHYGVLELYPRVSAFVPWIRQVLRSR
jgi:secreted trypsin-like serine protease